MNGGIGRVSRESAVRACRPVAEPTQLEGQAVKVKVEEGAMFPPPPYPQALHLPHRQ